MIPPSSLARLVLGYLEEEGLQRTAETFQEECNDAKKDPLTQHSLKTILEEYVEIKETASNSNHDPAEVISSLWKKLDVVVGQLKYHTMPENKIPRVKQRTNRRNVYGTLQVGRPMSRLPNKPTNSNRNKNPSQNKQDFVSIANGNQHVLPSATDADSSRLPPILPTASFVDLTSSPSAINNPGAQPPQSHTGNQQTLQPQNTSTSTYSNDFRQESISRNHLTTLATTAQSSSSGSLVCTCSDNYNYSPINAATSNSDCIVQVVEKGSISPTKSNKDTVIREGSLPGGHYSMESTDNKIEALSKSPKRKGLPPKKRNFNNPSPSKTVPVEPDPSTSPDNNFDLQQLLDGGNLDAAMPLLLDTFLSTPLLQKKLAENINKVVGSTKQNETSTEVLLESSQVPANKVDDEAATHQDEPQVPVDDILNLMEADPAFDAFFSLLSTDAKTASPVKVSQAVPTCSEPVLSGDATTTDACSSAEPVSSWSVASTLHGSSSGNNLSATSVVTESLLLLASSPSKGLTSTSLTSSLDNLHPISPKEVTPEFVHKQHKENPCVDGGLDSVSYGPGHVRSLQFLDQQPAAPIGKPKKSKPPKSKRNASKNMSRKAGRQRLKKLNSQNKDKDVQGGELLQGTPDAAVESGTLSTIDRSAVKLLQSFASLHSNANGNNGMGTGVKKSQGSSMVQLLQDAAIHQQVQGTSTKQMTGSLQSTSQKELIPRSLQSLAPATALSSLALDSRTSVDQVNGMNISRQGVHVPPRHIAPAPSLNHQGGRTLLPYPSVQSQVYGMSLQAPLTSAAIQPLSTPLSSSSSASLSSTSVSSSVTFAPGMLPSLSSSSSLVSSSPLYQLLSMPSSSSTSCVPPQPPSQPPSQPYLQTPQPLPQSSSSIKQSSSSSSPTPSHSQTPPPSQSSSSTPSSYLGQTLPLPPQSSSSTASYLQPMLLPQSSSSYALQSLLPLLSSSHSQPPPLPTPVPQSLLSSSSCDSSLSMSVNQPNCFSSAQQHSKELQNTVDYSTFTNLQTIRSNNQKTQMNSQGITTLEKSPSPVAIATMNAVEFEQQYISTRLDSNELSPTAQNAEECVSGFISGFAGGLSCDESNNPEGSTKPIISTLGTASLDKGKDGMQLPKNGTNRKENEYGIEGKSRNDPSGIQENKRKESREVTRVDGHGAGAEERRHGHKRPAIQDLKENKPKKSKGCKKIKKAKSKSLPKNFDVDKFLSKLHYVEN